MKRLAALAGGHWRGFVLAVLAMAVFAGTEIGFAFAVERLTALLGDASEPWDRWLPVGVLGLFLVRGMAGFVSAWQLGRIGRSVVGRMREMLFERFLRMPVRSMEQRPRAELLSRMLYDAEQVADASSTVITTVVRDSLTVLGLMAYMVYASAGLSAVVFVVAPLIALTARVLSRHFRRYSARIQENMGEVSRITDEALRGHRIIKVFGGSLRERERFSGANENNKRLHLKLVMARAGGDGLTMLLAAVGVASVAWFVARHSAAGGLEIEKFTGFMAAMLLLMTPLKHLTNVNAALQRGLAAATSVFGLLDSPVEPDRARVDERRQPARATGRLEFVNVAFSYESGGAAALRGRGPRGPRDGVCGNAPRRAGCLGGRGRHQPFGRRAAARGHRPRAPEGCSGVDSRRSHFGAGQPLRKSCAGGPGPIDAWPDHAGDRPSP